MKSLKNLKINQHYWSLVPRPTREEFTCLQSSIILEGQKDPIVINKKGIVLDGHTRYEILRDLGTKKVSVRVQHFETQEEEELYVISSNTNRRQLNAFQKIEIYYSMYEKIKKESTENHKYSNTKTKKFPTGGSAVRYAMLIGVGEKRTHAGIKLLENAPELTLTKLRNGSLTINQAYNAMLKNKEPVGRKYNKTKEKNYPRVTNLLNYLGDKDRETLLRFVKEYEYEKAKYG
jgi:hypothetical protein